jgi:uncharacterized membrane protein YhhN
MTDPRRLLALSGALALAYGVVGHLHLALAAPALAAFKASAIVTLAVLARARGARLVAAGLALGAVGDALLALQTQTTFLAGAGAFLLGHLCYIAAFLRNGAGVRAALRTPWRVAAMLAVVATAVAGAALLPADPAIAAPLGVYSSVLSAMTIAAFTLTPAQWPATAGAALFFVSDAFVALNMFHPVADPAAAVALSFTGWMIYWAGQAGICVGASRPRCRAAENPAIPAP